MEAAGLALGALPLAIHAFQTYREILSSMRNSGRDMRSIIRDLDTEMVILENTCEILLRGIAPDSDIDSMIETPYGQAWTKYDDEIRLRLWKAGPSFEKHVEDMMSAAVELRETLAINDQGKTRLTDRASILAELIRKTSFTLKKDDYTRILSRLKEGNAALSRLATTNDYLEPDRRSRSQTRAAGLIRRLSAGLFSALQGAITCACNDSHDLGLVIAQRKPMMTPFDREEDLARLLHFDVILGTYGQGSQRWDRMRVKLAEKEVDSQAPISPSTSFNSPRRLKEANRPPDLSIHSRKAELSSASEKVLSAPANPTSIPPSPITDLCQILDKGKARASDCYGFVSCKPNKFDLYHEDCPPNWCSTITLREILESNGQGINNFGYPQKLKLALKVSFGILYLYGTPWLSKIVTPDDIVFFMGNNTTGRKNCDLDLPFLAKGVAEASHQPRAVLLLPDHPKLDLNQREVPTNTDRVIDPTLLSLGLLLIQIITGNYSEQLHMSHRITVNDMVDLYTNASNMTGLIVEKGGPNYADAVEWCLKNLFSVSNLDNEGFPGQFYSCVISKLESDLKIQETAKIS